MERSKLILWCSVGLAGLMIVIVVGFIAPAGGDDVNPQTSPAEPAGSVGPARGVAPMVGGGPAPRDAADVRMQREQFLRRWNEMTEQEREEFRHQMRQNLAQAARQGGQQQREYELQQQRMLQMMIERRRAGAQVVESPKDPNE